MIPREPELHIHFDFVDDTLHRYWKFDPIPIAHAEDRLDYRFEETSNDATQSGKSILAGLDELEKTNQSSSVLL